MLEGGTVTFGTQTFPADGNAGLVVCDAERARRFSSDETITVQILGIGDARVGQGADAHGHRPRGPRRPGARRGLARSSAR